MTSPNPEAVDGSISKPDLKTILKIEDIHVHFGSSHILQGASLEVKEGMTAVVGRNGMGKTTLMNNIMGLVQSSSGRITFCGEDITNLKP